MNTNITPEQTESINAGDRVRHVDYGQMTGELVRFSSYPMAIVRWDSTGRESSVNMHFLTRV